MTIHPRLLAYLRQALDGVVHADTCFLVFCPGQRSRRIDEAHEPAEVLVRLRGFVIRSDVLAPRYFVGLGCVSCTCTMIGMSKSNPEWTGQLQQPQTNHP